ncbi:hypothetical protein OS493_024532 [Desmophyllum pertusum]|uniref:WIF domain-containing protein n=1 Tax=Desmophyllum pertusum TaxID=174260 RepID=A0A9W9ZZS2_9CNID|nr:hypothetical protein OS493_024532 [Desmophyllum pertusum]
MCTVSFMGRRSTTWSYLVVLLVFCFVLNQATAQLSLFISKEDAKTFLKMDFQGKLYLIQAGVPATMVQNPSAFYRFMSPIEPSVSQLQLSWVSSPLVSHYSMRFNSSDHSIMSDPVPAIPLQGITPQSTSVFAISFVCSGKKGGEVDLTFSLNYTKIESGLVDTDDTKTFVLVVRRLCLKTATDGDDGDDDKIVVNKEVTASPWSRGTIVGALCRHDASHHSDGRTRTVVPLQYEAEKAEDGV